MKWYGTISKLDQNLETEKLLVLDRKILFKVLNKSGTNFGPFA